MAKTGQLLMEAQTKYKKNVLYQASAKKCESLQTSLLSFGTQHQKTIQEGNSKQKTDLIAKAKALVTEAKELIKISKRV
eukprot:4406176-Alexandrium_andersonii.AAC.1